MQRPEVMRQGDSIQGFEPMEAFAPSQQRFENPEGFQAMHSAYENQGQSYQHPQLNYGPHAPGNLAQGAIEAGNSFFTKYLQDSGVLAHDRESEYDTYCAARCKIMGNGESSNEEISCALIQLEDNYEAVLAEFKQQEQSLIRKALSDAIYISPYTGIDIRDAPFGLPHATPVNEENSHETGQLSMIFDPALSTASGLSRTPPEYLDVSTGYDSFQQGPHNSNPDCFQLHTPPQSSRPTIYGFDGSNYTMNPSVASSSNSVSPALEHSHRNHSSLSLPKPKEKVQKRLLPTSDLKNGEVLNMASVSNTDWIAPYPSNSVSCFYVIKCPICNDNSFPKPRNLIDHIMNSNEKTHYELLGRDHSSRRAVKVGGRKIRDATKNAVMRHNENVEAHMANSNPA